MKSLKQMRAPHLSILHQSDKPRIACINTLLKKIFQTQTNKKHKHIVIIIIPIAVIASIIITIIVAISISIITITTIIKLSQKVLEGSISSSLKIIKKSSNFVKTVKSKILPKL